MKYYLEQSYPMTIYPDDQGGYVAEIKDLPGCITQAETLKEAYSAIDVARQLWIGLAYKDGIEIPLPREEQEYSGKFIIRVPKYLHRRLSQQAVREGVSLNQYVVSLLAAGEVVQAKNRSPKV